MPRPRNHLLHSFFDKTDTNLLVCNIDQCKEKKLSTHSANLQRHLRQFHPLSYANYVAKNGSVPAKKTFKNVELQSDDISVFDADSFQQTQLNSKIFDETSRTLTNNVHGAAEMLIQQAPQFIKQDLNVIQKATELWTIKLQNMDPTQALLAEKLINDIIYNGQMGQLNQNTTVQLGLRVSQSMSYQNVMCSDMGSTFAKDEFVDESHQRKQ